MSFISYSFAENKLVYTNKLLPFNIKLISPIQKYPKIIESYACILKVFVVIVLLHINFLISIRIKPSFKPWTAAKKGTRSE